MIRTENAIVIFESYINDTDKNPDTNLSAVY